MAEEHAILLVDDDALQRELLALLLKGDGWHVIDAGDGEAALSILASRTSAPQLILCDLQMPGLCGPMLAKQMRERLNLMTDGASTTLLAMTATREVASVDGYAALLQKPLDVASLPRYLVARDGAVPPVPSATVADAEGSTVDLKVWLRLRASMPAAALGELCAMAIADMNKRVDLMRAAAAASNDSSYRREAHTLKGSSGFLGAKGLSALAAEHERDGLPVLRPPLAPDTDFEWEVFASAAASRFLLEVKALELMLEKLLAEASRSEQEPA